MSKPIANTNVPPFGSQEFRDYFRTDYIDRDAKSRFLGIKDGKLYITIVFILLISVPIIMATQITEYKYYYLLLLPIYFLILNLFEYMLHRYPMHHKKKGFEFLYEHVTIHHSFYNGKFNYYEQPEDYMAVFLPLLYFAFISAVLFIIAVLIYFVSDLNNALFFELVGYSYYLMYEVLHFSYHAKEESFIKKFPFIKQLASFHLQHHQTDLMSNYNFNITFPIFDKVFNTCYGTKS